jgi:tetratricopeptide (TPR) repeat protein
MTRPRRTRARLEAALVVVAALAVHARTVAFGFTGLDDRDLVVDDQAFLADPASLWRAFSPSRAYMHVLDPSHAYWRPLVTASYVLDARWGGARPLAYHATNVVLHAVASALVLALLRRFAVGRGVALAGALVFAVHPALASAVAWIPGRNDSLLGVTAFAAWLCLKKRRQAAHLVFFALALLTKETAMALPLVWAVEGVATARRGTGKWRSLPWQRLGRSLPWQRLGRSLSRQRSWLLAAWAAMVVARLAARPTSAHATVRALASNLVLVPAALGKLALPVVPTAIASIEDLPLWPGVAAAALLALATWRLPGVRRGVVATGAAAFLLLLAPSMLLEGTLALDQRLYLPAVGVLVMLAELARAAAPERRTIAAFGAIAVASLGLVTMAFESAFRDPIAFGREAVAGSPRSPLAHFCLGQAYQRAGADERALVEYRAALALGPAEVVHNDIAVIAMKQARWDEAERELREELAVNPGYGTAYVNLAVVLRHEGRMTESCDAAERALAQRPADDARRAERDRDCDSASGAHESSPR